MTQIIAAHFNSVEELQAVVDTLPARGFGADDYATYFLNPPGQRGLYWLGGDAVSDEGASGAGRTAAAGHASVLRAAPCAAGSRTDRVRQPAARQRHAVSRAPVGLWRGAAHHRLALGCGARAPIRFRGQRLLRAGRCLLDAGECRAAARRRPELRQSRGFSAVRQRTRCLSRAAGALYHFRCGRHCRRPAQAFRLWGCPCRC